MRYIVARFKDGFHAMERRYVGDVEVYEPISISASAADASVIVEGLNGNVVVREIMVPHEVEDAEGGSQ